MSGHTVVSYKRGLSIGTPPSPQDRFELYTNMQFLENLSAPTSQQLRQFAIAMPIADTLKSLEILETRRRNYWDIRVRWNVAIRRQFPSPEAGILATYSSASATIAIDRDPGLSGPIRANRFSLLKNHFFCESTFQKMG